MTPPFSTFIAPSALSQLSTYTQAVMTTATPTAWNVGTVNLFTVTGKVLVQIMAVVTTAITSTGATGTLEVGVAGATASMLPQAVVNGSNFVLGAVWTDTTPTLKAESLGDAFSAVFEADANIIATVATNNVMAGGIIFYCRWVPLSAGATVVSAA